MTPSTPRDTVDEFLEHALQVFPTLATRRRPWTASRISTSACRRLTESGASRFGLNYGEFKVVVKLRQVAGEGALPRLARRGARALHRGDDEPPRSTRGSGLHRANQYPDDRRGVVVRLTDTGRTAVDGAPLAESAAGEQRLLSALTPRNSAR